MREPMLILHFIGLAMGIGTSFAFMFLGRAGSKMEKEEAIKFALNTMVLSRMGHIGLLISVITGGYLMTPYWSALGQSPTIIAKLILVLVLGALIGIISSKGKKARKGDAEKQLNQIRPLGLLAMLTGIAIIVLAVYSFG